MSGSNESFDVVVDPFFLDTPGGRVFAVHHRPGNLAVVRGHVLCVPPFNEEMNRSRSMMTLQARAFAKLGLGTLIVDLHGTGDSAGEYRDARWDIWLDDIRIAWQWLAAQTGGVRAILGVRLGAILAAQSHAQHGNENVALVLWQPVLEGKVHLNQFFRVRMAAQLDRPDLPKETTASMRQQLASGRGVEVAGYEIHPELGAAIDQATLTNQKLDRGTCVAWLEYVAPEQGDLSPLSQKVLQAWDADGVTVEAVPYSGPAFWQVHERVLTPAIIERTSVWLGRRVSDK